MREIISNIIAFIIGLIMFVLIMLSILTPDKDKYGNYVSFRRYWTDNKYLCENFNGVDPKFCKQAKGE